MSNLILGNTTGEICCTIKEGYLRLTGAFAGPTLDRLSSNASSGFLIRDGNNNSGLYVSNCSVKNYKDKFEFSQTSNTNNFLLTQNNQILNISGNGSSYSFSPNGTFSIGCQAYSPFCGLQVFSLQPYLSLIQTGSVINNEINFLNKNYNKTFSLSQTNNSGVYLYSCNFISLGSKQCPQFLTLSGNTVSISGSGLSFGFSNFSTSYFEDDSLFSGNLNISGLTKISTPSNVTGLCVQSNSVFENKSIFCGDVFFTGGKNLFSDGLLCFSSGIFQNISGEKQINYKTGIFTCLVSFNFNSSNACISGSTICNIISCNINQNTGIYNCLLSGQNFYNCGFFCNVSNLPIYITGSYVEIDTPNTYLYTTLNLTGNGFYSGNQTIIGNFNYSGLNFNSTGLNFNVCSQNINLSGSLICFSGNTSLTGISGVQNIITSGFNVGYPNTWSGFVKSLNTPKAWGMISFNCGIPTLICGYNVNTITLPITGIAASGLPGGTLNYYGASGILANQGSNRHGWCNPFFMYGIALCERIMYPFHVDFTYHPTHHFDANARVTTGSSAAAGFLSCLTGLGTFSGTTCNGGPFSAPNTIATFDPRNCQLIPKNFTLINCAGFGTQNFTTGCFRKLVNNECYGEIIFNLSPRWTGSNLPLNYYRVGTPYISGSGSFAIYSL